MEKALPGGLDYLQLPCWSRRLASNRPSGYFLPVGSSHHIKLSYLTSVSWLCLSLNSLSVHTSLNLYSSGTADSLVAPLQWGRLRRRDRMIQWLGLSANHPTSHGLIHAGSIGGARKGIPPKGIPPKSSCASGKSSFSVWASPLPQNKGNAMKIK